jgi:hypothetical protein
MFAGKLDRFVALEAIEPIAFIVKRWRVTYTVPLDEELASVVAEYMGPNMGIFLI